MAREVLYRRSFHLERDLRGMENLLELDRAAVARKVSAGMKISTVDGGFEAPRNSLDVPFSGLLEMRRHSEVRSEEIPIGYELSRSLTTRRRDEEYSNFKPLTSTCDQGHLKTNCNVAKMNLESDHKPRARSVVARLMGLDALPHQENLLCSNQSSLRRVLPQECMASYNVPALDLGIVPSLASERDMYVEVPSKENLGNGELSFRNHPQEKQLQEFKREFTARQALQGRQSLTRLSLEGHTSQQQRKEQLHGLESQMDSEEFLDALDFLNANKEFFVKILNDPQSSFAKHLHQGGGSVSSIEDGSRQMEGKLIKSSFTDDSAEWMKKQDMRQRTITDKVSVISGSRWGRDEEMPGRPQWRARGGSTLNGGRTGLDQVVPSRIVVLKPNLSKQANRKPSSPSSPLVRLDGSFKSRTEGKENVKQDAKERMQLRNDIGLAREFFRDDFNKDGLKDARVIAKQIVKHVKEDMSQRLAKEGPHTVDSLAPMGCSTGRRAGPAHRIGGLPGDAIGTSDGEGYYRTPKENGKICLSLPSSPRPSRNDRDSERRQLSFNGRRGSHTDEIKRSPHKHVTSSTKSSREPTKVDEGLQAGHDSCIKQNGTRDSKSLRKTCRSTSLKVRDLKCEAPRVLPRSLSAPAATSVENRAIESKSKGGATVERASCISKARPAENSLFKERLLSLKDSFSLTKKRGSKKPSPPPLESSDFSTPRQLGVEQVDALSVDGNESCHLLPGVDWQAVYSTKDEEAKEVTKKSVDEMLSDNSTPSVLHQWTSIADLADSASETSLDKCEQPSPVSVLEAPFQEESPSSVDTRERDSKCHELRRGLSRLESDYKELPRNLHLAFFSQPSSRHSSFDDSADESLNAWNLPEAHLEAFGLCDVACAFGSEEELTYIMHVLSLSGLNMNGLFMAHSLSSEHGLNPSIFGRLEDYYAKRGTLTGTDNGQTLNVSSRRLLFDVVDEVVASMLKKRLLQPWTKFSNQKVLLCTGKQLLEQIFALIRCHRYVPSETEEEVLEDMASKDLMREAPWVHSQCDMQSVVTELERLLCGDLIREMVHECVRR